MTSKAKHKFRVVFWFDSLAFDTSHRMESDNVVDDGGRLSRSNTLG